MPRSGVYCLHRASFSVIKRSFLCDDGIQHNPAKKSNVWNFFKKLPHGSKCTLCQVTNLTNHLKRKHKFLSVDRSADTTATDRKRNKKLVSRKFMKLKNMSTLCIYDMSYVNKSAINKNAIMNMT